MTTPSNERSEPMSFHTILREHVPKSRKGKHNEVVAKILKDLDRLKGDSALKVSLAELRETKEKIRSALNRETRKRGRQVATASDAHYLYIWNGDAGR